MTADVAAEPDANATQCLEFSAQDTARSNAPRVGFPVREYSYPMPKLLGSSLAVATPGVSCRNVVARLIGTTTAPVGLPAWFDLSLSLE
jgi:hypothetical protein